MSDTRAPLERIEALEKALAGLLRALAPLESLDRQASYCLVCAETSIAGRPERHAESCALVTARAVLTADGGPT